MSFVANPNLTWKDVDPSLPDVKIEVLGPPPTSGTRDAFNELALEGGCKTFPEIKALKKTDKTAYKRICHSIREDGAYVEAGENDNLIVQKLVANPSALGIFGYGFLDQNRDRIRGSLVDGVEPSFDNIASGEYPVSRPLFFYVKGEHIGSIPGISEYVNEFHRREGDRRLRLSRRSRPDSGPESMSESRSALTSTLAKSSSWPRTIDRFDTQNTARRRIPSATGSFLSLRRNRARRKLQRTIERAVRFALLAASTVAVLVTIGILGSLIVETARFFQLVSPQEFFFGLRWSPADRTACRPGRKFGSLRCGTALCGHPADHRDLDRRRRARSACWLRSTPPSTRIDARARSSKPTLELLAGVPTVVYGFFAALIVAPAIRDLGAHVGLDVASESALAAGLVMGIMIIPIISSLSDDAITTIPKALRDASYALGATRSETIRRAILPAALPGLVAAFLLAISRAVGETMIVVMAAGLGREPDAQSARSRHHGDGADRHPADGRSGVRQRENPRCVRIGL